MAWRSLRGCSVLEANLASGLLEDAGFQVRVVGAAGEQCQREHLFPVDFDVQVIVEVLDSDFAVARAFLDEALPEKKARAPQSVPATAETAADARARATELASLGRRIRYLALTPLAPIGLWLASDYVARTHSATEPRPPDHAWNIAGIGFCVAATILYGLLLYAKWR